MKSSQGRQVYGADLGIRRSRKTGGGTGGAPGRDTGPECRCGQKIQTALVLVWATAVAVDYAGAVVTEAQLEPAPAGEQVCRGVAIEGSCMQELTWRCMGTATVSQITGQGQPRALESE